MRMPAFCNLWNFFCTISFNRPLFSILTEFFICVFCRYLVTSFTFVPCHSSPPAGWSVLFISVSAGGSFVDFMLFKWTWWGGSVTRNVYDLAAIVSVKLVKLSTKQMESKYSSSFGFGFFFSSYFLMLVIQSFNLILLFCTYNVLTLC